MADSFCTCVEIYYSRLFRLCSCYCNFLSWIVFFTWLFRWLLSSWCLLHWRHSARTVVTLTALFRRELGHCAAHAAADVREGSRLMMESLVG